MISKAVLAIGTTAAATDAAVDMQVHKFGRTTSYTIGRVIAVDADVTVGYDMGDCQFQNQILIVGRAGQSFSDAGDSGSLIMERGTNKAVGLLFAGSPTHTMPITLEMCWGR